MMIVICTLLFSKILIDVRKDVLNAAGRDSVSKDRQTGFPNGPQRVMIDFNYMTSIVELVKRVGVQNKPAPMDLGFVAEVHDHAEYVQWNDHGALDWPEDEWTPEGAQQDTQWQHGNAHRLAAIAKADASHRDALDAINGKGGRGKGKKGKGKGKTMGKGKDKGKVMKQHKPTGRQKEKDK